MKKKIFKASKYKYKAYLKQAGEGYEVGLTQGSKKLFIGNFLHSIEASHWFNHMNKEIVLFGKRFKVGPKYPNTWFEKCISSYLYKQYYSYVTKLVTKRHKATNKQIRGTERKYKVLKQNWVPGQRYPSIRAA